MFERTWRFRDIPGSMLVRVSVEPISSILFGNGRGSCRTLSEKKVVGEVNNCSRHQLGGRGNAFDPLGSRLPNLPGILAG